MSVKQSKQPWQRVGVFLDSQNLFYTAKYLYKARVNFNTLLEDIVGDRRLVRAIAYVIKTEEGEESSFFDALEKIGFDVKAKPLQIFYGGNKKGDWDIGIAMDIVRMASKLDVVILLSGDGDFVDLIEYAKAAGCRTEAAAFGRSSSSKLKEEVDEFIDLDGNDRYLLQKGKVRLPSDYRKSSGASSSSDSSDSSDAVDESSVGSDSGDFSSGSAAAEPASLAAMVKKPEAPSKPVIESVSEKVKIVRGGARARSVSSGSSVPVEQKSSQKSTQKIVQKKPRSPKSPTKTKGSSGRSRKV